MSQYSDQWLERVRQKDSIIDNNVDGGLHQLVRNLAGELLELRRRYRLTLEYSTAHNLIAIRESGNDREP